MDPLGFALENYDAIGKWRTQGRRVPGGFERRAARAARRSRRRRRCGSPERADAAGVRPLADREDADLRARPRPRALRPADGPADHDEARQLRATASRRWSAKSSTACRSSRAAARRCMAWSPRGKSSRSRILPAAESERRPNQTKLPSEETGAFWRRREHVPGARLSSGRPRFASRRGQRMTAGVLQALCFGAGTAPAAPRMTLERAIERRFRLVADLGRDIRHALRGRRQRLGSQTHSPPGHVRDRRIREVARETLHQRGAGQADLLPRVPRWSTDDSGACAAARGSCRRPRRARPRATRSSARAGRSRIGAAYRRTMLPTAWPASPRCPRDPRRPPRPDAGSTPPASGRSDRS